MGAIPLEGFTTLNERAKLITGERVKFYLELGYYFPVEIDGQVCGLTPMTFTWSIMVGIDETGYSHRYCYDSQALAMKAYIEWILGGAEEPDGYIVRKGLGPDKHGPASSRAKALQGQP